MKLLSKKTAAFILLFILISGLFLVKVNYAAADVFSAMFKAAAGTFLMTQGGQGVSAGSQLMASGVGDLASGVATAIIKWIAYTAWNVAHWLLGLCSSLFSTILNFTTQNLSRGPVYDSWVISRDIVNMFFILGLIVIAFATILRIETYGMKALLPKFIVIALLINFSYLACGIIIDAANIPTLYFVQQIGQLPPPPVPGGGPPVPSNIAQQDIGGYITAAMISPPESSTAPTEIPSTADWFAIVKAQIAESLIMIIATIVLLIGAILLIVRMGALWILIILAPFAWFMGIFPKFSGMNDKWWSQFLKYAFFSPIFVFFIFLGLRITRTITADAVNINFSADFSQNIAILANCILAIVIFMGAPMVAMSMGIYGAQAVTGFAKGALKGTVKGAYKLPGRLRTAMITPPGWMKAIPGVKRVTTGLQKAAIWTTPAFWKTALKARKEEAAREAGVPEAIGKMHDVSNRILSVFTRKTDYAEQAHQFEVGEEVKRMMLRTKGTADAVIGEMRATKERTKRDAGFTILAGNNDFNDLVQSKELGKPYNQTFSRENFVDLFYKLQAESGVSERKASAFLASLQEQALRAGTNFYGAVGVDEKGWKRNTTEMMNEISARKALTMDMRQWTQKTHPMSLIKLDANNNYAGLDTGATKALAKHMTPGIAKDLDFTRSRIDFVSKVGSPEAVADLRKLSKDISALPDASAREVVTILADRLEQAREKGKGGKVEKPKEVV